MTPEALDHKLRTISDHEALYRQGIKNIRTDSFPRIMLHGRKVMRFSYADISAENDGIPFLVKKHSRFQDYPEHIHDWVELSFLYSGKCIQILDGERYEMQEGQVLMTSPGTVHTLEPLGENDILVQIAIGHRNLDHIFFNRSSTAGIVTSFLLDAFVSKARPEAFYIFATETSRRMRVFITEFLCEWFEPSPVSYNILNDLFSLIISELVNALHITSEHAERTHKGGYIFPALRYIEDNYRTCTLQDTAEELGLQPNYLSAILKKYTGYSFISLVQKKKLTVAEKLLQNSEMSVTDIAHYVGYQNISFFYRIFKEKNHCLPGDFRNMTQI